MPSYGILGIGQAEQSQPAQHLAPTRYREPATLNQELNLFLFLGTPSALGAWRGWKSKARPGKHGRRTLFRFYFAN